MSLIDRLLFKAFKIERSFSQIGEDKILSHLFQSMGKRQISYLDVGANHPIMASNTYLFYIRGGSGVCVEPNPDMARLIEKRRSRDKCLNVGIGMKDGESAKFYLMSSHTLNTFSQKDAEELNAAGIYKIKGVMELSLMSMNTVLEENFPNGVDLVSIDVEGWNAEVVSSIDLQRHRPVAFCVETITFSETGDGREISSIKEYFEANEYNVYAHTHLNTIFLANEHGNSRSR